MNNHSILTSVGLIDTDGGIKFKNESFSILYQSIYDILNLEDYNFNFNGTQNIYHAIEDIIENMNASGNLSIKDNDLTYLGAKIMLPPFYICSSINRQNEERTNLINMK